MGGYLGAQIIVLEWCWVPEGGYLADMPQYFQDHWNQAKGSQARDDIVAQAMMKPIPHNSSLQNLA